MSYWCEKSQRQFVIVVRRGAWRYRTKVGDVIIAHALPRC